MVSVTGLGNVGRVALYGFAWCSSEKMLHDRVHRHPKDELHTLPYRTHPAQWQTALELRKDCQRVLASGRPANEVQAWLEGLLGDALKAQA